MKLLYKLYLYSVLGLLFSIFLYAGILKLLELNTFYAQLAKSPLIPLGFNKIVGISVISIELYTCYLIYKKQFDKALFISFSIMTFFTFYIGYLISFSYFTPCSCGGILEDMTWENHFVFNLVLTVLTAIAYLIKKDK
jgi:hypothetical protein